METVLVKRADHPDGAVLINKADFVEGKDEIFAAPEPVEKPVEKPKAVK